MGKRKFKLRAKMMKQCGGKETVTLLFDANPFKDVRAGAERLAEYMRQHNYRCVLDVHMSLADEETKGKPHDRNVRPGEMDPCDA